MHLAITFTPFLLIGSFVLIVAAAPSIHHQQQQQQVQIHVDVVITHSDAQNQADTLHFSEKLVMNDGRRSGNNNNNNKSSLPFNFTLFAHHHPNGPASLSFGFENLDGRDGLIEAELGFTTVFALRDGKLITGNRALGYNLVEVWPPRVSLWTLNRGAESNLLPDFVAFPKSTSEGKLYYDIEFLNSDEILGAFEIKRGDRVFVGPSREFQASRILLEAFEVGQSSSSSDDDDIINADSAAEEIL